MKLKINSKQALQDAQHALEDKFSTGKYFEITIHEGKRTNDQNALIHCWFGLLDITVFAKAGYDAGYCKKFCKYTQGMAILAKRDDPKSQRYLTMIRNGFKGMTFEERIELMDDHIPVTSLMTVSELTELADWMQRYFLIEHGVRLGEVA